MHHHNLAVYNLKYTLCIFHHKLHAWMVFSHSINLTNSFQVVILNLERIAAQRDLQPRDERSTLKHAQCICMRVNIISTTFVLKYSQKTLHESCMLAACKLRYTVDSHTFLGHSMGMFSMTTISLFTLSITKYT